MSDHDISMLVKNQFPEYVRDQHKKLISFINAYYEFMESDDTVTAAPGAIDSIGHLAKHRSIDTTLDQFIEYFRREFLESIPPETLADKRLLVKHIKEFYRTKGTEKSFKFLFRILYNEDVQFYYPGRDILRASDGKWQINKTIKTTANNSNYALLLSRKVTGQTSGATGIVEKIESYVISGTPVHEYFLSNIKGNFVVGEVVRGTDENHTVTIDETIRSSVIGVNIVNHGSGYIRGSAVTVKSSGTPICNGIVSKLYNPGSYQNNLGSSIGGVDKVKLSNSSLGTLPSLTVTFVPADSNHITASGTVQTGALFEYPGVFLNEDSFLSDIKKLEDNFYYQDYSYVLRTTVSADDFKDLVKKANHPAGMLLFTEVSQQTSSLQKVTMPSVLSFEVGRVISIIQKLNRQIALRANQITIEQEQNNLLTVESLQYKDVTPINLFGGQTRGVSLNQYYQGLINKKFTDLLVPDRFLERGLYAPGVDVDIATSVSGFTGVVSPILGIPIVSIAGSTFSSPLSIPNILFWFDANDLSSITKDGSNLVSQWNDLSGNGFHVTQADSTKQPTYQATGLNSKPTIRSVDDRMYFVSGPQSSFTDFTAFAVFKKNTLIGYDTLVGMGTNGDELLIGTNTDKLEYYQLGSHEHNVGQFVNTNYYATWQRASAAATITFRQNGSSVSTVAVNGGTKTLTAGTNKTILGDDGTQGEYFDGYVSEIIYYNRLLSGAEISSIESYLKTKWGL